MELTRGFKETVHERVQQDPDFAAALLNEALELFINGEPEIARLILRDLVMTGGVEEPVLQTARLGKSL